jgi:hypothetical protein
LDAFFLAMSHHRLGQAGPAREWLRRGTKALGAERRANSSRGSSWTSRLELEILRREAVSLIDPGSR